MTEQQPCRGGTTAQVIRNFLAAYDASDASDRYVAARIRERLCSEWYRREREHYPEWVDHGGEAG